MANEWTIKEAQGGQSGSLLDGCQIRKNADGSVDFLGVLATATGDGPPYNFPEFAYQGLVWNLDVNTFNFDQRGEVQGKWSNNAPKLPGEEEGTYTGQAGSGGGQEEDCREDAASAGA